MITKGDIIKIKPEYQDEGDSECIWIAVDNEEKGRVTVEAQVSNMTIKPTYILHTYMIEGTTK